MKFDEFELLISATDFSSKYREDMAGLSIHGRKYVDVLKYCLALSMSLEIDGYNHFASFTGGIGVLINLINRFGLESLIEWRGTEDVDLVLKDSSGMFFATSPFESYDTRKSQSIPGKETIIGEGLDLSGISIGPVQVDVSFRDNNRVSADAKKNHYLHLPDYAWSDRVGIMVYDIPMYALSPIFLLTEKLSVRTFKDGNPRFHDEQDIYSLLSCLESSKQPLNFLDEIRDPHDRKYLRNLVSNGTVYQKATKIPFPSSSFLKSVRRRL